LADVGIDLPAGLFEARQLTPDSAVGPLSYTAAAEGTIALEDRA
jgi:hypothetical protein